eukprot:377028-Pyramimonas_sp.AAC.1
MSSDSDCWHAGSSGRTGARRRPSGWRVPGAAPGDRHVSRALPSCLVVVVASDRLVQGDRHPGQGDRSVVDFTICSQDVRSL